MFVLGAMGGISNVFPWKNKPFPLHALDAFLAAARGGAASAHPPLALSRVCACSAFSASLPSPPLANPGAGREGDPHHTAGWKCPPSQPNSAGNALRQMVCREHSCHSQFPLEQLSRGKRHFSKIPNQSINVSEKSMTM